MSTMETGTPRPTKRRRFTPLELPPCLICGGKGSGIHFGVNTCMGCKAFFQRCLKREQPYVCPKSGICQIVDSFRGNCSACRLQKCITMGMSREGIRMGRYTSMERAIKITEVKNLQVSTENTTSGPAKTDGQKPGNSPENRTSSDVHRHCDGQQIITVTNKDQEQSKKNKTQFQHQWNVIDVTKNFTVIQEGGIVTKKPRKTQLVAKESHLRLDTVTCTPTTHFVRRHCTSQKGTVNQCNPKYDDNSKISVHHEETNGRPSDNMRTSDFENWMKNTLRKKLSEYEQRKLHKDQPREENRTLGSTDDVSYSKPSSFSSDIDGETQPLSGTHHLSDSQSLSDIIESYSNSATDAEELLTFDFLEDILSFDKYENESRTAKNHVQENTHSMERQCFLNLNIENVLETSSSCSMPSLNDNMEEETVQGIIKSYNAFVTAPHLSREEINAKLQNAYEEYQLQTSLFGPMKALSLEEYKEVRRETGLDIDGRMALMSKAKQIEELFFQGYVDFAHAIPGFIDLPFDDQYGLLMSSVWDVNMIRSERGTSENLEMVLLDTGDTLHFDQSCLFQTREITKKCFDMHKQIHQLQLENSELAMAAATSIMFRDRCRLHRSNDVEQIQSNLVRILRNMLYRRLQSKDEARKKFVKIIDLFVKLRDLSHILIQSMKQLCKDELIQEIHPNCDVIFEDDSIFAWA